MADLSSGTEESGGPWAGNAQAGKTMAKTGADEPADRQSSRQLTVQMTRTTERENKAFIADKYGKVKTKKVGRRVDAASYHKGRAVGENVSLNRQIK